MYLITNGRIITEDFILTGYDILVQQDIIAKIVKRRMLELNPDIQVIDANGGYVSPGFIDIHSDYIEHMAAPRPTCLMDFNMSIRETERELVSHGITTMFHSLSLFKSSDYKPKPIRSAENVSKLIDLIDKANTNRHLIRHRFHARFEIDNLTEVDTLKAYITENKVHLVSFMDHTPGQGQYRDLTMFRNIVKSYDYTDEGEINNMILNLQSKPKLTFKGMKEIADLALEKGIPIASHDDDSIEKLELVQSLGATISEFPITLEIAKEAKQKGMFTMAGAPNILLGGSHNGNLSAAEAIQDNIIDILCSDYYPPSLLHAVFQLHKAYELELAKVVQLITFNPAKAVNMDQEIGSIKEGKKADLLIIETMESEFPVITTVLVEGKMIQRTNYSALKQKVG